MNSLFDIVFINPPMTYKNRLGPFENMGSHSPPFNLCYLAAAVREHGYIPAIIDSEAYFLNKDEVILKTLEKNPNYVGITAMTLSIKNAAEIALMLKKYAPNIKIILGGVHVTALPIQTFKNYPQFDFAVIGEGEKTIIELLEALKYNKSFREIKGIIYRHKDELITTEPRQLIQDIDNLPSPAFDLLPDFTHTYRPAVLKFQKLPSIMLSTSRGCPYKCIFCDSAVLKDTYRTFSIDYIIKLIQNLKKTYNIKDINFQDDTLTISKPRINEFCDKIFNENITWSCQARVDTVTPDLLLKMKNSGCWSIAFGIESGNQEILDVIEKGITLEQIHNAVNWANEIGLETIGFLMIGNPLETPATIEKTIDFVKSLPLTYILPWFFTPFPGTKSYNTVAKYGKICNDWEKMSCSNPVFLPSGLTHEDLNEYYKKLIYKFYFRPRQIKIFLSKLLKLHFIKGIFLGLNAFLKIQFNKKD
ncbi:MAG: cobalamin B12-binding domain-containing protein [Candidatus Firestonebacteria bacterium]|nr:cobalamin B12-binding domain-containing protein [Candidatus Firestonebacteria bacterium]